MVEYSEMRNSELTIAAQLKSIQAKLSRLHGLGVITSHVIRDSRLCVTFEPHNPNKVRHFND